MKDLLAIMAALLAAGSTIPYVIDTVRKQTKPNIVTWSTWSILTLVAAAAAFAAGEPRTAALIGASTISTAAVVVAGLWHGVAKFSWFDGLCQAGAVLGLGLWLLLDSPTVGIVIPVCIDFVALLPTVRHAWLRPGEETWQAFVIAVVASLLTLLSLSRFNVNSLLYPLYLFAANLLIVAIVIWRRLRTGVSLARVVKPPQSAEANATM
ncbi:hypothetical protein H7097_02555 [Aeromicrobium sp.]|nr:hypothetical protein [Candidatus Saccharibacteria bacterium]